MKQIIRMLVNCKILKKERNQSHFSQIHIKFITLNNIGSLERTLQYYYHATPGEPLFRV